MCQRIAHGCWPIVYMIMVIIMLLFTHSIKWVIFQSKVHHIFESQIRRITLGNFVFTFEKNISVVVTNQIHQCILHTQEVMTNMSPQKQLLNKPLTMYQIEMFFEQGHTDIEKPFTLFTKNTLFSLKWRHFPTKSLFRMFRTVTNFTSS